MTSTTCPSLSTLLVEHKQVVSFRNTRGWIETPDGRHFQPKSTDVQFIRGMNKPFMSNPKNKRRWFAKLMGIFA